MITFADKLSKSLGVNPDWFLTGNGEMLSSDVRERNEIPRQYKEIGRAVHEVLKKLQKQES